MSGGEDSPEMTLRSAGARSSGESRGYKHLAPPGQSRQNALRGTSN